MKTESNISDINSNQLKCKVCGQAAPFKFQINKTRITGEIVREEQEMVDYYQCSFCSFLFTPYLDTYSAEQLNDEIYNETYWTKIDPSDRSGMLLEFIRRFGVKKNMSILDYGCASGKSVSVLLSRGYKETYGYDINRNFKYPQNCFNDVRDLPSKFDFIYSFEVLEHLSRPLDFFEAAAGMMHNKSILFFTTYLFDPRQGRDFWYLGPRNGHISIFDSETMNYLSHEYGFDYIPMFRPHLHCFIRKDVPIMKDKYLKFKYGFNTLLQKTLQNNK